MQLTAVNMKRRRALGTFGGALIGGLAGCLGFLDGSSSDYDVGMSDSAFEPSQLTVAVGTTVRWKNTSGRAHTVTAYGNEIPAGATFFASGNFDDTAAAREGWQEGEGAIYSEESYQHTFETAGEHPYFCIPHERAGMVATVIVED